LDGLPPIITFQSVMDFTVSTSAIVSALYSHLPSNGSELVLFDVNRTVKFGPLLRPAAATVLTRLLPAGPRAYRTTIITNSGIDDAEVVERSIEAATVVEHTRPLGLTYPAGLYSLSHVALPFPLSDALYGLQPDPAEDFGIHLGILAPRGERNVLIASLDALLRVASNPFFPYMIGRIEEGIASGATTRPEPAPPASAPGGEPRDEASSSNIKSAIASLLSLVESDSDSPTDPP
jgi:hypothetical protein